MKCGTKEPGPYQAMNSYMWHILTLWTCLNFQNKITVPGPILCFGVLFGVLGILVGILCVLFDILGVLFGVHYLSLATLY